MLSKKNKKTILCFMIFSLFICTLFINNNLYNIIFAATDISQNTNRKNALEKQNSALQKEINGLKGNIEEKKKYKDTLLKQINVVQEQIDVLNSQINDLNSQIKESEEKISSNQARIDDDIETLKKRIKSIYMAGETSTLDIILGAKDFSDFLDKAEIVKIIGEHDSKLIDSLKQEVQQIEEDKSKMEVQRDEVYEQKKEISTKQSELDSLLKESNKVITELEGKQATLLDKIDENNDELKKIRSEIENYYKELAKKDNATSSSSDTITPSGSGYTWPVPGYYYISSNYYDKSNRNSMHRAIDIAGSQIYGKPVVAADNGTIKFCNVGGYGGGYGTYMVIDHGNGRSTLYAHMSGVAVKSGTVKKGQVIGYVGSTGFSTGPHLHFETMLYGKRYDPMTEYK